MPFFNINLIQNFNRSYFATSVIDFWRRWHISFSRWILDYIFKPLQIQWRNWKNAGTAAALIATFLVSGIWHGASWGFVIWGGLHGLYMACSVLYKPYQKKLHDAFGIRKTRLLKIWQIFVTFNLVSFAWVFFRANNLSDAFYIFSNVNNLYNSTPIFRPSDYSNFFFVLIAIACYISFVPFINDNGRLFQSKFRWVYYYALFFIVFYLSTDNSRFIYFQF